MSDIEKVILGITGVTDWVPSQITPTVAGSGGAVTNLILANTLLLRSYGAFSGYIVKDPINPFASTLNFVPASD